MFHMSPHQTSPELSIEAEGAEGGDVAAQSAVAMMYANGKGVQQNYAEAGKWWSKAGAAGDLTAARHAWNLYRNGEGVDRNPAAANQMAVLIGEPIQAPGRARLSRRLSAQGATEFRSLSTILSP